MLLCFAMLMMWCIYMSTHFQMLSRWMAPWRRFSVLCLNIIVQHNRGKASSRWFMAPLFALILKSKAVAQTLVGFQVASPWTSQRRALKRQTLKDVKDGVHREPLSRSPDESMLDLVWPGKGQEKNGKHQVFMSIPQNKKKQTTVIFVKHLF